MTSRRMGRHPADDEFVAYYAARADRLRNTAYLLCGDWHFAEDLMQVAVTKLYQAWHRIERHHSLDQYARRVLLRAFLDERRRPWRREYSTMPNNPALDRVAPDSPSTDERMVLRSALQRIPKRRRAVLVLRFFADQSVEQVADILGCSTGTVKSQTAHGLANLRDVLGAALDDLKQTSQGGTRERRQGDL
jgi:RNA polymerase sigma-70 factor (sigma-E family)